MTDFSPYTYTPSRWASWTSRAGVRLLTLGAVAILHLERRITRAHR
ncbi:MAG: hypothetical protein J7518_05995 [Nocardioidaceae bacterium]|nr:hypothetical protein [Nocardioidaceae bacterium]